MISNSEIPAPDLDFEKYAVKLAELDKDTLLEHIGYWRGRCLKVEDAAQQVLVAWDADDGYDGVEFVRLMQLLAELVND